MKATDQMDLLNAGGAAASGDPARDDLPRIRVSRRARRLAVRVYPDARVEVVVPPRARPREVEAFLAAQRDWIESKRAQALRNRPAPEMFPPLSLALACTGEILRLHVAGGSGRLRVVE
jgi:predicted metal-dependent hydrolase